MAIPEAWQGRLRLPVGARLVAHGLRRVAQQRAGTEQQVDEIEGPLGGFQALTIYGAQYALIVMGALLVFTVLLAPEGIILGIASLAARITGSRRKEKA
mgnify:CR=1 FL=1